MGIDDADAGHDSFGTKVRSAVIWRSGGQIVAQTLSWISTIYVMRQLDPADYGLFAMTQVILNLAQFLNGYGLVSALVQAKTLHDHQVRQALGIMILLNGALAAAQLIAAPIAADYYNQPLVADLLRVQSLIYLTTPFIAMPEVLMGRSLDFRGTAIANLIAAIIAALAAIIGATLGWGVWTLVFAPIIGFYVRALGYMVATRFLPWPSFDFRGTGWMVRFGASMLGTQLLFMVATQTDIVIGGRVLGSHELGLYAEALFLTQIFVSKFLPALNDVAFPAYARMQHDLPALSAAFCRSVKLILLIATPLYFGMAVAAEPFVATVLGQKWLGMTPFIMIIAACMPLYTLKECIGPALNAIGRPGLTMRTAAIGAVIMPLGFLIGSQFGAIGLAWAWAVGVPLVTIAAIHAAFTAIGVSPAGLARAVGEPLAASAAMGACIWFAKGMLPDLPPAAMLGVLVLTGMGVYGIILWSFARGSVMEMIDLVYRRKAPEPVPA